jgi:transcriptional regulator with XRE-family HTH domain
MLAVRLIRLLIGFTLYELARRTGIAASRLSLLERGLEVPSDEEVRRISEAIPGLAGRHGSIMRPVDPDRIAEAIL